MTAPRLCSRTDTVTLGEPNLPLTDIAIRKSKPRERAWKLSDGGGMYLLLTPDGGRYWRLDYRFNGKRKTLALGVYPSIGLATARDKRDGARKQLGAGVDPAQQRKLDRIVGVARTACTFRVIAAELLDKMQREGRANATLKKSRWVLEFAYPQIGDRPIGDITPPEVLAVLRTVEARGCYETARRMRSVCGKVFRLAIASGRAERDPTQDLRGALIAPKPKHRAAIIEPKAVGALLRAIDGYDGHLTTRAGLQLLALTFVRPGELRHAEWAEFDLDARLWIIPAEKMKMRRPHRVPLAAQAAAIVQALQPITGHAKYVFPSVRSAAQPMSDNTLNAALRRLGYGTDDVTAHGFRSMAAVRLNEMGRWNPDAIERQLAHQEANQVRRAYTHAAEFWAERVRMMNAWADYLDQLRATAPVKSGFGASQLARPPKKEALRGQTNIEIKKTPR